MDIFEKINYDIEYVNHMGFLMDWQIIWLTVKQVLRKTGAEASEESIKFEIEELKKKKTMKSDEMSNQRRKELDEEAVDKYSNSCI